MGDGEYGKRRRMVTMGEEKGAWETTRYLWRTLRSLASKADFCLWKERGTGEEGKKETSEEGKQ
jgi:hypothetical protein